MRITSNISALLILVTLVWRLRFASKQRGSIAELRRHVEPT